MKRYILTFLILGPDLPKNHFHSCIFNVYRLTTKIYDEAVANVIESNPKFKSVILINSLELDIEDNVK